MPISLTQQGELRCATCGRRDTLTIVSGESVYCGVNCLLASQAALKAREVQRMVESGRGGSPVGLEEARGLLTMLKALKPLHPGRSMCPQCWSTGSIESIASGRPMMRCPFGHAWRQED